MRKEDFKTEESYIRFLIRNDEKYIQDYVKKIVYNETNSYRDTLRQKQDSENYRIQINRLHDSIKIKEERLKELAKNE